MRRLLALLVLAGFAGPAAACINDNELPKYEREFRSQYRGQEGPPATPSSGTPYEYILLGTGGALMMGATVIAIRRPRS